MCKRRVGNHAAVKGMLLHERCDSRQSVSQSLACDKECSDSVSSVVAVVRRVDCRSGSPSNYASDLDQSVNECRLTRQSFQSKPSERRRFLETDFEIKAQIVELWIVVRRQRLPEPRMCKELFPTDLVDVIVVGFGVCLSDSNLLLETFCP